MYYESSSKSSYVLKTPQKILIAAVVLVMLVIGTLSVYIRNSSRQESFDSKLDDLNDEDKPFVDKSKKSNDHPLLAGLIKKKRNEIKQHEEATRREIRNPDQPQQQDDNHQKQNADKGDAHRTTSEKKNDNDNNNEEVATPAPNEDNHNTNNKNSNSNSGGEYSSEPPDPVYHNHNPIPRRKKIFAKPPKIQIDPKFTSKAAENMFFRFYDSFDKTKLYREGVVVPAMVTPTFHDGDVLRDLLEHVSVPIRHLIFICNAEDSRVEKLLEELAPLERAGGMTVFRFAGENRGFAKSINLGLRRGRQVLLGYSELAFLPKWNVDKLPIWYAPINCDAVFRDGSWEKFSQKTNYELQKQIQKDGRVPGLFYGNIVDHYAFGVSDAAIRAGGYFDEVFFPAYMEDIDFKWRIHNAGFRTIQIHSARIDHHQSINLKRSSGKSLFKQQMHRGGLGFEYGWMKWGFYDQHHTRDEFPPSRRKYPFNIQGYPIHLWKIDPKHRECLFSGNGVYFKQSSTCWYNGTGLLKVLPKRKDGEEWKLPRFLREPTESMRDYTRHGHDNGRVD